MQSQNTQIDPLETVRSDADESTPNTYGPRAPKLSPLARAALANGVSFADVSAYVEAAQRSARRGIDLSCFVGEEIADAALDAALARSVLAQGTIAHARLWWRGVL